MVYTQLEFFILFAATLALYIWTSSYYLRSLILITSSFLFYAWAGVFDFFIFIIVIVVSYWSVYFAHRNPGYRRWFVYPGVALLTLHLFTWKYLPWISHQFGSDLQLPLPLGISFFTLQGIGYLIDYSRNTTRPMTFREFLLFKSFFPQLISGPIVRARDLFAYLRSLPTATGAEAMEGVFLIATGLVKKLVIADFLAMFADGVFSEPGRLDRPTLMLGAVAFYLQIWGDFSGYTDMGRGCALLLGVRLPQNFYSVLYACSPTEWGQRWHATLGNWMRDYVYKPLMRIFPKDWNMVFRHTLGMYITLILIALWHGASFNFLLWGVTLCLAKFVEYWSHYLGLVEQVPRAWRKPAGFAVMFVPIMVMAVMFRSQTIPDIWIYLQGVFGPNGNTATFIPFAGGVFWRMALAFGLDGMMYYDLQKREYIWLELLRGRVARILIHHPVSASCAAGVVAGVVIIMSIAFRANDNISSFIYFRF